VAVVVLAVHQLRGIPVDFWIVVITIIRAGQVAVAVIVIGLVAVAIVVHAIAGNLVSSRIDVGIGVVAVEQIVILEFFVGRVIITVPVHAVAGPVAATVAILVDSVTIGVNRAGVNVRGQRITVVIVLVAIQVQVVAIGVEFVDRVIAVVIDAVVTDLIGTGMDARIVGNAVLSVGVSVFVEVVEIPCRTSSHKTDEAGACYPKDKAI